MFTLDPKSERRRAAMRLAEVEHELRAAQAALQRDDCNENRERYAAALRQYAAAEAAGATRCLGSVTLCAREDMKGTDAAMARRWAQAASTRYAGAHVLPIYAGTTAAGRQRV